MLSETRNRFSQARVAPNTREGEKSNLLAVAKVSSRLPTMLCWQRLVVLLIFLTLGKQESQAAPCASLPQGAVGWWRGDNSFEDNTGTNHGVPQGNIGFANGRVGNGFMLDGSGDAVNLGSRTSLYLQNLTIEGWIKRTSATTASYGTGGHGTIVSAGDGGYFFWLEASGTLHFNAYGDVYPLMGPQVADTLFHHVAVTKNGNTVVFYLDGQAYAPVTYEGVFTFNSPIYIGMHPGGDYSFLGTLDEISIYNRALSSMEILSIFTAADSGKCFTPTGPVIISHPIPQSVAMGDAAVFSVIAGGTAPLNYQWRFNGTNIPGATGTTCLIGPVDNDDAGNYSVVVSNAANTVTSSNALLTVLPAPPCITASTGLVAWWRAQGTTADEVSGVSGALVGDAYMGPGRSGMGFVFDGLGDGVLVGNLPQLHLQDLTIECWIKRSSASAVSAGASGNGTILSSGTGGYFFWMDTLGRLRFNRYGDSSALIGPTVGDLSYHHVAITKAGTAVVFYLDGQATAVQSLGSVFTSTSAVAIGFRPDAASDYFWGTIDELGFYNRALSTNEVQRVFAQSAGGKCPGTFPPFIVSHPTNQTAFAGSDAVMTVVPAGTPPFHYQWLYNGGAMPGKTASVLTLTNVQFSIAGTYAVIVSNALGTATSSNAVLSVTFPPAAVSIVATTAMAGGPVVIPVEVLANGNENALDFSVTYNTTYLTFAGAIPGPSHSEAGLAVTTSQVGVGRVGCTLTLPPGRTMQAGPQAVVLLSFNTPVRSSSITTSLSFSDSPVARRLANVQSETLPATYMGTNLTLVASVLEADASPRPNGDRSITVSDWALVGRYAARLDYPTNAAEFQKADCAPRNSFGDGSIKVTDWVQTIRYASGVDSVTRVGGPTFEVGGGSFFGTANRRLRVSSGYWFDSQTAVLSVVLTAAGDEAAVGGSLSFDPSILEYLSAAKGSGSDGAILHVNSSLSAAGNLGFVLGLNSGSFGAGDRELVRVSFRVRSLSGPWTSSVSLHDNPVPREVSDITAFPLGCVYEGGLATLRPIPQLAITKTTADSVLLTWPAWATNFSLQARGVLPSQIWTNVSQLPALNQDQHTVLIPANEPLLFYRLAHP